MVATNSYQPDKILQLAISCNFHKNIYTGLFEMIVAVLTTCHLVLQMHPHVISFYGVTSRIRFMFLPFTQVSRN